MFGSACLRVVSFQCASKCHPSARDMKHMIAVGFIRRYKDFGNHGMHGAGLAALRSLHWALRLRSPFRQSCAEPSGCRGAGCELKPSLDFGTPKGKLKRAILADDHVLLCSPSAEDRPVWPYGPMAQASL